MKLTATILHFDRIESANWFCNTGHTMFAGRLKKILLFVNPQATDEELLDALYKASCQNLLERAEKGIETVIGEGGLKLAVVKSNA